MHSKRSATGPTLGIMILAAALFHTGCSALKPVPDTTRYYTLVPVMIALPAAPAEVGATRVGVRVNVQTDYLRRPPIAIRQGANEVRFAEAHRWAENIDEAVERVLTLALQSRLSEYTIVPVTHGSASGAPVIIDVVIAACEGTTDGTAVLEGYWKITSDTGAAPTTSGRFRRTRDGWDAADYGQLAGLLGALVDEFAAEIAPAIEK